MRRGAWKHFDKTHSTPMEERVLLDFKELCPRVYKRERKGVIGRPSLNKPPRIKHGHVYLPNSLAAIIKRSPEKLVGRPEVDESEYELVIGTTKEKYILRLIPADESQPGAMKVRPYGKKSCRVWAGFFLAAWGLPKEAVLDSTEAYSIHAEVLTRGSRTKLKNPPHAIEIHFKIADQVEEQKEEV